MSFMRTTLAWFPQVRLAFVEALMWFGWRETLTLLREPVDELKGARS